MPDRCLSAAGRRWLLGFCGAWCVCACGVASDGAADAGAPAADGRAIILLYHHVATDTPPSTSVTPDTFDAHLDYLREHDYRVLPLSRVIEALTGDAPALPPRAVAITFDDAYDSVYSGAAPLLERHGYPYTVFVSTGYIDRGFGNYLTWDQLRELEQRGAEIGNHSRSHDHYLARHPDESDAAWRKRISADIRDAQDRLETELETPLTAVAYPYGEFTPSLTALVAKLGLVGFGQQSGPAGPHSDLQALPRFPMASRYAELEALAEKLATRPFRVVIESPADPVIDAGAPPPALRLRVAAPGARLDALSCFVNNQEAPRLRWIDQTAGVFEVTAQQTLPVGRSKYTCTTPARDDARAYYWYSHLWMVRPADGGWYRD